MGAGFGCGPEDEIRETELLDSQFNRDDDQEVDLGQSSAGDSLDTPLFDAEEDRKADEARQRREDEALRIQAAEYEAAYDEERAEYYRQFSAPENIVLLPSGITPAENVSTRSELDSRLQERGTCSFIGYVSDLERGEPAASLNISAVKFSTDDRSAMAVSGGSVKTSSGGLEMRNAVIRGAGPENTGAAHVDANLEYRDIMVTNLDSPPKESPIKRLAAFVKAAFGAEVEVACPSRVRMEAIAGGDLTDTKLSKLPGETAGYQLVIQSAYRALKDDLIYEMARNGALDGILIFPKERELGEMLQRIAVSHLSDGKSPREVVAEVEKAAKKLGVETRLVPQYWEYTVGCI